MVNIKKGQKVPQNKGYVVFSDSGEYDDHDLILCIRSGDDEPTIQFEAQFIANGAEVYSGQQEG